MAIEFLDMFRDWEDVESHDRGSVIFAAGDKADMLYFILSGKVGLTLHEKPLGTESAGSVIGETAMLDSARQSVTATAGGRVRLARLDRRRLKQISEQNVDFSLHVMSVLANRLIAVDRFITRQYEQTG